MNLWVSVSDINNHVDELVQLSGRFSALSKQSVDKFGKIIETAQVYHSKMSPLNTYMESLQVQKRNIQACYDKLSQIQTYRKTAREFEATVERGPVESLPAYLNVLQLIQEAFEFLKDNSIDDVESTRLQSLYTMGLKKLADEFEVILKSTFNAVDVDQLYNLTEKSSTPDASQPAADPLDEVALIEIASEPMIESLKFLTSWLKSRQRSLVAAGAPGTDGMSTCLLHYHNYRREVVRSALNKFAHMLKVREGQSRPPMSGSVARLTRAVPKRPPGFVWDVASRRQLNEAETEELNSEHLASLLAALVKLMQNERRWLLRIQLTHNRVEDQISLDSILKISSNELLNECQVILRLMQIAEKRADYHMVLSLLVILKKLSVLGSELMDVLQGVDHILFGFNSLTYKLLQDTASTLKNYVAFLGRLPEHATVNRGIVPPDATVHELTTNSFMFFENLLEFADVLSVAFRLDEVRSQGTSDVMTFLSANVQNYSQLGHHVGKFLLNSVAGLIDNLECKSLLYQEELMQLIFQMNNLHYILKIIQRTDIHRYILSYNTEGISSINALLDERRVRYSRACSRVLQLPSATSLSRIEGSTNRNLDSKDRAAVKSLWQDFNSGLTAFLRLHAVASVPDRDLRDCLQGQLIADLLPLYSHFWERSMNVAFTTHREKYMRCTVSEFESKLKQLFGRS